MIKKPLATMPTLNSRRIRLVLTLGLLLLCLIKTIHLKLTSPLNQAYLEYQALQLQQLSNFNPKNNLIELFDYLNTWHINNTLKELIKYLPLVIPMEFISIGMIGLIYPLVTKN